MSASAQKISPLKMESSALRLDEKFTLRRVQTISHAYTVTSLDIRVNNDKTVAVLLTGSHTGRIRIDVAPLSNNNLKLHFKCARVFRAHVHHIAAIHYHPCRETWFLTAAPSTSSQVIVWSLGDLEHPQFRFRSSIDLSMGSLTCAKYSHSGMILTGDNSGLLLLYGEQVPCQDAGKSTLPSPRVFWSFQQLDNRSVACVAWSTSNLMAACFGDDTTNDVRVWDADASFQLIYKSSSRYKTELRSLNFPLVFAGAGAEQQLLVFSEFEFCDLSYRVTIILQNKHSILPFCGDVLKIITTYVSQNVSEKYQPHAYPYFYFRVIAPSLMLASCTFPSSFDLIEIDHNKPKVLTHLLMKDKAARFVTCAHPEIRRGCIIASIPQFYSRRVIISVIGSKNEMHKSIQKRRKRKRKLKHRPGKSSTGSKKAKMQH